MFGWLAIDGVRIVVGTWAETPNLGVDAIAVNVRLDEIRRGRSVIRLGDKAFWIAVSLLLHIGRSLPMADRIEAVYPDPDEQPEDAPTAIGVVIAKRVRQALGEIGVTVTRGVSGTPSYAVLA